MKNDQDTYLSPWRNTRKWIQAAKFIVIGGPILAIYAVVVRSGLSSLCVKNGLLLDAIWCGAAKAVCVVVLGIVTFTLYRWLNK